MIDDKKTEAPQVWVVEYKGVPVATHLHAGGLNPEPPYELNRYVPASQLTEATAKLEAAEAILRSKPDTSEGIMVYTDWCDRHEAWVKGNPAPEAAKPAEPECCVSCGEPSTHMCDDDSRQFVCGFALCDNCEHAPDGTFTHNQKKPASPPSQAAVGPHETCGEHCNYCFDDGSEPQPPRADGPDVLTVEMMVRALREVEEENPKRWFDALADRLERAQKGGE